MTSVEIPYSIACALPSLTVIDITNDVPHELARNGHKDGIADKAQKVVGDIDKLGGVKDHLLGYSR